MRTIKDFPGKTCCIVNPFAANRKWKRRKLLRRYFKRIFPVDIIDDEIGKVQAIEKVRKLCQDHDIIAAAGGDGTIADVIQGIVESGRGADIKFGIIPFGSGNAFRKSLGLPKSIRYCVQFIAEGRSQVIDLVDINGQPAAFASIGATAQAVVEKLKRKTPGLLGHLLASGHVLRHPRWNVEIELFDGIDDSDRFFTHKILQARIFDAVINKTKHFGYGWRVAPQAQIDDGYIDLTLFETTALKYLIYFPAIYLGLFQRTQRHFKAKKIIFRGKALPIQYHGELLGIRDEIEMQILPRALQIITPKQL